MLFKERLTPNILARFLKHAAFMFTSWLGFTVLASSWHPLMVLISFGAGYGLSLSLPILILFWAWITPIPNAWLYYWLAYGLCISGLYLAGKKWSLDWILRIRKQSERSYWFLTVPIRHGLKWSLLNRVSEIIPELDLSFGAGLCRVRFGSYLIGSCLGKLPMFLTGFGLVSVLQSSPLHFGWLIALALSHLILSLIPVFYRHFESWGSEQ